MPSPLLRPLTPATEAYQQEQQAMAPINQQAAEMDTIAQAQASEQAFAKQVQGQAAEAERAQRKQIAEQKAQESRQKEMLANAKRAGVKTTFDGGGQEQPVLHPDGQPVFEHGFQGDVQPGDNGHTVDYRDPRGRVYKVPTKAIRSSQDPAGNPLYEFNIKKEDGTTDTIRQPVGSKPLWNTDPKTGDMYTGAPDPETGSYGQTKIGVDTTVAGKAALARQKELFDQQQAERKFQSDSLMLDQNVRETNLAPVKKQLTEAQAAAKKMAKAKVQYKETPEGYIPMQDFGNGLVEGAPIPSTDPSSIVKAKAWLEQKAATDKALADAKTAHDPLAAEVQTMQQKRDQLAIDALNHSRSAQVQMMQMEKAQKAGLPVHEPDWQKRIAAARTDPRITSIFSQAELDQMGGPLAEDAKRVSLPETTKLMQRAFTPDFNLDGTLTEDPTAAPAVPMQRPEASLANHIGERLTADNVPVKGTDVKALTTQALGITEPEKWQVTPSQGISGELGYHTLTHNGEDIGEFSTRENRFVLNPPSSSDMDRQQQRLINTSSDGLPVYFASATPPLPKAAVSDMIRQGVDISRSSTDRAAVESKLAEAKLSPADLRQKVMNGELSVQDGRLLNETFHGIKDVDASKPAIEAAFGQHLTSPVLGPLFKKGDLTTRQGIVNQFMDAYAERAGSNIIAPNRSELAKLRSELLAKADPRGATGKGVDFALDLPKNVIAPLAGMIVEAVSVPLWYGPRKLLGYKDKETDIIWNGSRDLIQRQANTANFAHRLFGQGEMKDILGELKTSSDKIQSVDELPDEVAHKLRDAAYDGYHRFTDENAKDVNTTRDNYDIKKDPTLRAMFDRYLKTADGGTFDSMLQMLSMTANDRATQKQTMQYLERPQTATTDNVIERAKLLDVPLDEGKAAHVLTISKQLDTIKDEKQYKNLITQAGKVLGLEKPADVQMALSHLTREETDAPDSWRSLFRAGTVADVGEFATEVGSDILTGALTASIMGAPEAGMIKAAQVGARQGLKRAFMAPVTALRDGFSKVVGGSLDSLAEKSARFGSGRAMLAKTGGELADKYRKLGIATPKLGQPLTAIQKASNKAVGTIKSIAAAAPIEATEEGVSALLQANPNKEDLVNSMVMGALGGSVLVPMFAGAQSLNRAWQSGKRNRSITDYKTGLVDKFNQRMARQAGFTPLTVADFDIMQGIQDNPAHQTALQDHAAALEELGAATQEHTQNVMDYQDAAAGNAVPAIPDSPRLLTAQANAQRTAANVEGLSSMAFSAMDELRALPDDQRPLYTGIAKAVSGATDYTEAEGKALIGLGGQSAVAFQQAQALPADVAGPANMTQLPGAPTVQQTGLGSYRLPAGVRIQVPPQAIAALQERAPSLSGLIGGTQQNAAPVQNGSKAPNTAQSTSSTGQNGPQGTNTQAQAADPVAALQANGGAVVHVADHKAAEALAGRTVQKGRRAFTQRIAGKPTVVIIDSEVASQKSRGGEAEMLAEEVAHAQTMLDEDANPDLAQAADDSMADSSPDFDPKLDAFMRANYNGYHKLSNRQKRYEAVAKIVSGKYTGQVTGGPLMAILKAILDLILKRNPSGTNAALNKIAANVSRALGQKAPVAQSSTQAAPLTPALETRLKQHGLTVSYTPEEQSEVNQKWGPQSPFNIPPAFVQGGKGTAVAMPKDAAMDDTPIAENEVLSAVQNVVEKELRKRNTIAGRPPIVTSHYQAHDGGADYNYSNDTVRVNPLRLAVSIWADRSTNPTRAEVARAAELVIDHEVVHAAQMQAARDTFSKLPADQQSQGFMPWVSEHYGAMWRDDLKDVHDATMKIYGSVLEGRPDWHKAFEALRMIVQERTAGSTSEAATFLTERIREHLKAALAVLKRWYADVMAGVADKPMIKAEIEAIEALLANNSQAVTHAINNTTNTNENQTGNEKGNGQGRQGQEVLLTGSAASPPNTGGEVASLNFNVPLTKRGQVRQSVFPDAESLAAFQFKLDLDTAASAKSTPEESAAAKQRGIALLAKMMEDSPLTRPELEKKLLEYHADVVTQAEGTSALDTFTPPAFHTYAKTDELASKSLPPPAGGDIISGMQAQGIRRIGPPVDSSDWSWYRELEADAANSKLKPGEAQRLARAGDVTDARARLAWINANVVSAKSGRPIDKAAAELNASADQSFPVETGDELGRAIMEALDARAKAKQGDPTTDATREQQAKDAAASFDTLKAGAEGQPFTASQLSKSLSVNDELKIGPEYFHVVEVDPIDEYVRMKSRFGPVEITGEDKVNLNEGPDHLRIGKAPPVTHTMPDGYVLTEEGMNAIGSAPTRAYHGTPHKVDKFSLDKIGTGEGAQAYGWGLYFAGNKAVAQQYQKGLTERDFIRKVQQEFSEGDNQEDALDAIRHLDLSEGQRALIDALAKEDWWGFDYPHQAVQAAIREPQNFDPSPEVLDALDKFGQLYTVDLLPDEEDFLDWDLPLSEQSEKVKAALREMLNVPPVEVTQRQDELNGNPWVARLNGSNVGIHPDRNEALRIGNNEALNLYARSGAEAYNAVNPDPQKASDALAQVGIQGVRYLDGGSRRQGEGTHNYVLFDENLVRIIAENGKPVDSLASAPSQPRAQTGGEVGPNGEWYSGGAFIATKNLPKKIRDRITKAAQSGEQIEPGYGRDKIAEIPTGKLPIVARLVGSFLGPDGSINQEYIDRSGISPSHVAQIEAASNLYKQGERLLDVQQFPLLANFTDAARLMESGMEVPTELIGKMPSDIADIIRKQQETIASAPSRYQSPTSMLAATQAQMQGADGAKPAGLNSMFNPKPRIPATGERTLFQMPKPVATTGTAEVDIPAWKTNDGRTWQTEGEAKDTGLPYYNIEPEDGRMDERSTQELADYQRGKVIDLAPAADLELARKIVANLNLVKEKRALLPDEQAAYDKATADIAAQETLASAPSQGTPTDLADAISAIESNAEDPSDADYWPENIAEAFADSPMQQGIENNDFATFYEGIPESLRTPQFAKWAEDSKAAETSDEDVNLDDAEAFLESDKAAKMARAPFLPQVAERVASTIRQIEATGRYKWNAKTKTFDEMDEPQVLYSAPSRVTPEQDAEYMAAVESGDVAKQQAMVDAAAKAAGYTVEGFHGTDEKFTEFKSDAETRRDSGEKGKGFYFSPKEGFASLHGKHTGRFWVRLKNPFAFNQGSKQIQTVLDIAGPRPSGGLIKGVAEANPWSQKVRDGLVSLGYDGATDTSEVTPEGIKRFANEFVVFDSNQIKSADPITRDAEGKVIPLSKRFNPESDSILYSAPTESAPSRVTPEQDAEYMQAVKDGNVTKQQAMVDAAAKAAAESLGLNVFGTSIPLYHGGAVPFTEVGWNLKSADRTFNNRSDTRKTFWLSSNKDASSLFALMAESKLAGKDPLDAIPSRIKPDDLIQGIREKSIHLPVRRLFILAKKIRKIETNSPYPPPTGPQVLKEIQGALKSSKEKGYDGVVFHNLTDFLPQERVYAVFPTAKIKSADPVTRDAEGNVIPLSQRFNSNSDSILYSAPTESAPAQATPDNEAQVREIIASMPKVWQDVLKDFNAGKSVEDIAKDRLYTPEQTAHILSLAQGRFDYLRGALPTKPKVAPTPGGEPLFKGGRPDLAYGSIPAFAAVDQNRGTPEQVTHAEMQEAATRMFAIDPAAAEKLVTRWMDGGGMAFSVEDMPDGIKAIVADAQSRKASMALMTAAAQIFTVENAFAGGSSAKSARLIDLYRNSGEEFARALSQRRDVFETPAERNAWFLSEVLLTPPPSIRSEMKRNPANKAKILAEWAARADQIKKELLAEDIDIDATMKQMAKERELAAATIPEAIKPALAQAPKSVRQAVKTILEGGTWQDAINASGLGHKAAQKAYNAFRGLRNIGSKIAAGIRDTLGSAPSETFTELPEWTDDVNLKSAPINTPQTKALAIHRNRKMEGEIDLKNDLSVNKTRQAMALRKASGFDKLMEYWKSSILSGPLSAIVNVSSGLGFGAYRVLFKKLSASVQADIIRLFGFQPDAPSLRDFPAMLSAVIPSLQSAGTDMLRSWNNETQFFDRFATDDGLFAGTSSDGEQFDPAIKGIFGKVMRGISFRHMTAADEFVKSFLTRIEVGAQALQIARNEGKTGEALATAMKDLMRPGSLAWERALSGAKVATFQSQEVRGNKLDSDIGSGERAIDVLDNLARILGKAKKGDFGSTVKVASHFLFPFVGTPTNIFKTGITMSPAGGLLALIDASRAVARSRKGNHQEAAKIYNAARAFDDITNQIVCWGVMLGIASLVKPGDDGEPPMITGSTEGDASSGERELTYRAAPPYSIRLWGKWYSYKRLDPLGTALAFCVDSVREFQKGKPIDKVWAKIGTGMLATMQDKTFMKSISDISNVLHDPERYGTQWIAGIATGFVPNLIRQPARATDHVFRETDFPNDMPFAESFARRIGFGMYPSPSNPLAPLPAVDAFGRESAKNTGTGQPGTDIMLRLISPLESLDATNVDPLDKKFLRYNMTHDKGFSFTAPPREITRTIGGKEIKISLSDEEYLPYEKSSGQAFHGAMNTIYGSKTADYSEQDHDDIVHLRTKVIKPFTDAAFSKALRKRQLDQR